MTDKSEDKGRKNLINEIREYAQEQYDKLIVYLSAGALVLSIGFVKDVIKLDDVKDTSMLRLSWAMFGLSLFFILLSHRIAVISMNQSLKGNEKVSDDWDVVTEILNWLAMIALIGGVFLFTFFINKNI